MERSQHALFFNSCLLGGEKIDFLVFFQSCLLEEKMVDFWGEKVNQNSEWKPALITLSKYETEMETFLVLFILIFNSKVLYFVCFFFFFIELERKRKK